MDAPDPAAPMTSGKPAGADCQPSTRVPPVRRCGRCSDAERQLKADAAAEGERLTPAVCARPRIVQDEQV
jgi:hypothetical protein